MYLVNVWPTRSQTVSGPATLVVGSAVILGLVRSVLWIRIYWKGAQAFGFSALVLAFLTHHYGQLLRERSQMKQELELTF